MTARPRLSNIVFWAAIALVVMSFPSAIYWGSVVLKYRQDYPPGRPLFEFLNPLEGILHAFQVGLDNTGGPGDGMAEALFQLALYFFVLAIGLFWLSEKLRPQD